MQQGKQEDDQEDQAKCDESCDDKMTFEKMQIQTHKLMMNLSPCHTRWKKGLATLTCAKTREKSVCGASGEVFCLQHAALARRRSASQSAQKCVPVRPAEPTLQPIVLPDWLHCA